MREFYERFYAKVPSSPVHALFCQRAFGLDLGQHGFADLAQLDALVEATDMRAGRRVLDLGCGDGRIAEYLSHRTGAHLTGLDYIHLLQPGLCPDHRPARYGLASRRPDGLSV